MKMALVTEYVLAAFCLLIGVWLWKKLIKTQKGLPLPGPRALPILGNVLQIGRKPHMKFTEWSKKYGPIFRVKMGMKDAVVISDHKLMKELFSDNASTGRMLDNPIVYEFTNGPNGIVNSSGPVWESQRRFTVKTLKSFGFAKSSMESRILDEARILLEYFQKNVSQPVSGDRIFRAPNLNSLWRLVAGERFEWESGQRTDLDIMESFLKSVIEITTNGLFFAPFIRFIAPDLSGWNRYMKAIKGMSKLFNESIKRHRETFDPNCLRDYVDHHLFEIENTTDPNSSFYKEKGHTNLVAGMFDLFVAGSETTATTLSWALLYLSHHQSVQKRFQAEIDRVMDSRPPSLADRPRMPYAEAIIFEVLRISSVVPFGVPKSMLEDKMFHGYYLPKGVDILGNSYAAMHDPDVWGDPFAFRPERFLNEDESKVVKHEALIPFFEGKRQCPGETMAKDTSFLFLTSIFQRFKVVLFAEAGREGKEPSFEPDHGFILTPKPFQVVMQERSKCVSK